MAKPLAAEDALSSLGGLWTRGRGVVRFVECECEGDPDNWEFQLSSRRPLPEQAAGVRLRWTPGVKVVELEEPREYDLSSVGKSGVNALFALASNPSDSAVTAFVSRFGCLVSFRSWIAEYASRENVEPDLSGEAPSSTLPWPDQIGSLGIAAADEFRDSKIATRSHSEHFLAGAYADWVSQQIRAKGGLFPYAPEPVALYIWAGQQLAAIKQGLESGRLERNDHLVLESLLSAVYPVYSAERRTLYLGARNLLAHLTAQVVLDALGSKPEMRVCSGCGRLFQVSHGLQRYCQPGCRW